MSENSVEVPFGSDPSEQATLLLAAAEDLGLDQAVVGTQEGAFLVPQEVHDQAFGKTTKKAAAKKSAAKK